METITCPRCKSVIPVGGDWKDFIRGEYIGCELCYTIPSWEKTAEFSLAEVLQVYSNEKFNQNLYYQLYYEKTGEEQYNFAKKRRF